MPTDRRRKTYRALLLLLLFTGYWSSISLFPHTHQIDGQTIVHSHPYRGTAGHPQHTHTSLQFHFYASLQLLFWLAAVVGGSAVTALPRAGILRAPARPFAFGTLTLSYSLRAPPAD